MTLQHFIYRDLFITAVTGEQVVCIEIQRDCTLNSTGMPSGLCDMTCSAIDQIVDNEYKKHVSFCKHHKSSFPLKYCLN